MRSNSNYSMLNLLLLCTLEHWENFDDLILIVSGAGELKELKFLHKNNNRDTQKVTNVVGCVCFEHEHKRIFELELIDAYSGMRDIQENHE